MPTKFSFEAVNQKAFDVDIELDIPGNLSSQSGSLPFRCHLKSGQRTHVGWVSSPNAIEPSWSWAEVATNNTKTKVSHHDCKGVLMTQTQVYKELDPENQLFMTLKNTNSYGVEVEINFTGDGTVDMLGRQRPIKIAMPPHGTSDAGSVNFTGEINVSWGWVQTD